jgi:large subunit ribosomal protein L10
MSKKIKEMVIAAIRNRVSDHRDLLLVNSALLDGVTTNRFRLALRAKRISMLTVPNSLAKQALNEIGLANVNPLLSGPTSLIWGSDDIVALSKEIAKWARELKPLEVKGGIVEGKAIDAKGIEALSKSPSREELIGQIIAQILSPGARLAGALLGPGAKLASQLKTLSDKEEASTEETSSDTPEKQAEA